MSATAPGSLGVLGEAAPPPFSLPASHFAAATAFFALGAAGLVVIAPDLALGAYLLPRVVAVTHLFTLGWITTSILGALYQFLPVALGESIRWPRVARLTFWLHVPGLVLFVGAMVRYDPVSIAVGASLFGTGLLLFAANLAATLRRAATRDVTWWALASACSFLVLTVLVGGALAANLRLGFLGGDRFAALGTHMHVALIGWVLMVMVGVGHRLLPMFLLSHGADERPGKVAVALLTTGTAALFATHHVASPALRWGVLVLLLEGAGAFLLQARLFFQARRRRVLDPGMRLAAAGLATLGSAAALGVFLVATGFASPRVATAYVLLLVLGISLFVAAHHYKIVPFLVWYHRFGPLAGRTAVPKVAELYDARWAGAAGVALTVGTGTMALGVLLGAGLPTRMGAAAFALGAAVLVTQMAGLARRRPDPTSGAAAAAAPPTLADRPLAGGAS